MSIEIAKQVYTRKLQGEEEGHMPQCPPPPAGDTNHHFTTVISRLQTI